MGAPIRVLIVDDDQLVRTGLRLLLRYSADIEVVGEAFDGPSAFETIVRTVPDTVLLDVHMPSHNGLVLAGQVRSRFPNMRIVLMSSVATKDYESHARNVGADAFIVKTATREQIVLALVGASPAPPKEESGPTPGLTLREHQVTRLLSRGYTNDQIARELSLSVNTVKTYVSRAMSKVGVDNRVQLANFTFGRSPEDSD